MSDKFFFKGRQDARLNSLKFGYQPNASRKSGSKKHPLLLQVTSEVRKQEVEQIVADAKLYANVVVDNTDGAIESIVELTRLLHKAEAVKVFKVPTRNELCNCGSEKKYKKCCG
jgi:SWIM/SEC-C metal-binding protein